MIDEDFGYWLAGYTDGEGCFLSAYYERPSGRKDFNVNFVIVARSDDYPLLRDCYKITKLGRLHLSPAIKTSKPSYRWIVSKHSELLEIVEIFDKFSLRSKKRKDFEIWKKIVILKGSWKRGKGSGDNDHQSFIDLTNQLKLIREYNDSYEVIKCPIV